MGFVCLFFRCIKIADYAALIIAPNFVYGTGPVK